MWLVIVLALLAIGGGAAWYFVQSQNDGPLYQTATVTRGELTKTVTATGTLNPVLNVQVGCQVSGRIKRLYVDYNSEVESNQLIAEIDPSTYQAQVNQAEADLANAKANLQLQEAQALRSAELYTNNLISASDYDTAMATRSQAAAMVQIKEAALSNSRTSLGYCKIYSPVSGTVISRSVDVGQTVAASLSAPTLFQIANDLTKMQIDASTAEADVGGVQKGQNVDFTVDAYPDRIFHGVVTQVRNAPTTVNNVVTYDTVIGVSNADYKLKPGMTANVSIIIAQRSEALKLSNAVFRFRPPEALTNSISAAVVTGTNSSVRVAGNGNRIGGPRQGRRGERSNVHTVYLLKHDGNNEKLQPVQIKTGISDGIYTEVLDELKEGDEVVVGALSASQKAQKARNPFGGGFPRIR